jgi:hypothetical protein
MCTVKILPRRASMLRSQVGFSVLVATLLLLSLSALNLKGGAGHDVKMISEREAEHLLRAYLRSIGYDTKEAPLDLELTADSRRGEYSQFYLYAAYVDTPDRLANVGDYGVNGSTGDIWERVGCKRIDSDAVRDLQKRIRKSTGVSAGQLKRIQQTGPCF